MNRPIFNAIRAQGRALRAWRVASAVCLFLGCADGDGRPEPGGIRPFADAVPSGRPLGAGSEGEPARQEDSSTPGDVGGGGESGGGMETPNDVPLQPASDPSAADDGSDRSAEPDPAADARDDEDVTNDMDAPTSEPRWVGAWASGQQLTEPGNLPPAPGLAGNTLRQKLFATLGGSRLRVLLSNEWGNGPVTFESVRLAAAGEGSDIDPATQKVLTFGGSESVTIAPGEQRFSDAFDHALEALRFVAVTIHFGNVPSDVTGHPGSRTTSFLVQGDAASAASLPGAATTDHWYYVAGIDVERRDQAAAVVTLGDSITDGRGSTTNQNDRWPDNLARRLQASAATATISVLNQGIGGNAVVAGGLGPTATARFRRDVLEMRGARWVIVLEGVNDIGGSNDAGVADRLIAAYEGFIDAARERGLLVYGVPILPFGGSQYDSPQHEAARQRVNAWIRDSGRFDAVIDLAQAVADPADPTRLLPAYDTGDRLHLSPAGYRAMADAIDLSLFTL